MNMQESTQTQRSLHEEPQRVEGSPTQETQLVIMKRQNDRLRQELKVINEFLTQAIVKQGYKKQGKQPLTKELRDDTLKHEITNAQKQIDSYKKEISKLNAKVEREYKPEMVESLKQDLVTKDQLIGKLTMENKALQKVQREQSKALKDIDDESYMKQIHLLVEENRILKEQMKEVKKKEPTLPVIIRNYYQNPDESRIKADPNTTTNGNASRRLHSSAKPKDESEKIQEMEKNIQILQKIRKQYDVQIEQLYARIKTLEEQNLSLTHQLEERNKEFNTVNYRGPPPTVKKQLNLSVDLAEQPKSSRQTSVEAKRINESKPVEPSRNRQPIKSGRKTVQVSKKIVEEEQKEPMKEPVKEVEKVVSQPQQIRHIEKGTINSNNSKFTDAELLNGLYNYKICQIRVWTDEANHIKGLQAVYMDHSGKRVEGADNVITGSNSYIVHTTDFNKFDYLKQVGGRIGLTGNIELLELMSQQNKPLKCGVEQVGQRKFRFEISETEVPMCMFGSLNLKSSNRQKSIPIDQSVLASLGFEVVRDEVAEEF